LLAGSARADTPWIDQLPTIATDDIKRPVVELVVRGDSKTAATTLGYVAHVALGDMLNAHDLIRIKDAVISSGLFEEVEVVFERRGEQGIALVATLVDKHSWIVAPTVYVLPGAAWAAGFGFAENNWHGENKKLLLYGQVGSRNTFFFGTYLDPSVHGSKLTLRFDLYPLRRVITEYANPANDATSTEILRTTTMTFLNGGALVGWNFAWWMVGDLRLRSAYTTFRDPHTPSGEVATVPERDGWDTTVQARLTIDARHHDYGVTWGPYVQLWMESTVPGLDSYGYQDVLLRAYQSWRLRGDHQLELRAHLNAGRHLPLHEDLTLGGIYDIRGYPTDQFRGDRRLMGRAEYSVPIMRWKIFAFRALGFFDAGYIGLESPRTSGRDYLPGAGDRGSHWTRTDVGAGLRVYVKNVVLPLLGFDVAYGIESKLPALVFEVGLTDF
jgi:outer membrane protein insertion porin family